MHKHFIMFEFVVPAQAYYWKALSEGRHTIGDGYAPTVQDALAAACDALQACPEVVGGG